MPRRWWNSAHCCLFGEMHLFSQSVYVQMRRMNCIWEGAGGKNKHCPVRPGGWRRLHVGVLRKTSFENGILSRGLVCGFIHSIGHKKLKFAQQAEY